MRAVTHGPPVFADSCGDLLVTLQSLSRQGEKRSLQLSGKVNSMTFTFDNVLPGKYKSKTRGSISWPSHAACLSELSQTRLSHCVQLSPVPVLTLLCPLTLNVLFVQRWAMMQESGLCDPRPSAQHSPHTSPLWGGCPPSCHFIAKCRTRE